MPNDLDTIMALLMGVNAVVADTNARVRRMEQAWVDHVNEEARWHRVQEAIAVSLDPELATVLGATADEKPQMTQTPLPEPTPARDALISSTEALQEANARLQEKRPEQTVSRDTPRDEIDPNTLDFFVGKDGKYYVHNGDGTDRRATKAEQFAIDGVGRRPTRRRR